MKQMGFTLLELLIAITILAVLMLFSNQSIQNGMRAKAKIQDQIEDMSSVRDALRVMEKDINLAFHYRDIESEYKQAVQKANSSAPPPTAPPPPTGTPPPTAPNQGQQALTQAMNQWLANDPGRRDPTTAFVGATDEMHFITMNAPRLTEDLPQADFIKVGYYLSDCRKPGETGHSTKCLLRSADSLIENDVTKNGPATVLLENITEFKLRYVGINKPDWVGDWNSIVGDAGTKGYFPGSVEISLTISKGEGTKKKKISMQIIAPIRFPNNPTPGATPSGQAPTPGNPVPPPAPAPTLGGGI